MIDTSKNNNKKSLWGLAIAIIFVAVGRLIGVGGVIEIILFFIGLYIGYKFLGNKKNTEQPPN
jgi:hypothetical protein